MLKVAGDSGANGAGRKTKNIHENVAKKIKELLPGVPTAKKKCDNVA